MVHAVEDDFLQFFHGRLYQKKISTGLGFIQFHPKIPKKLKSYGQKSLKEAGLLTRPLLTEMYTFLEQKGWSPPTAQLCSLNIWTILHCLVMNNSLLSGHHSFRSGPNTLQPEFTGNEPHPSRHLCSLHVLCSKSCSVYYMSYIQLYYHCIVLQF